MPIVHQPSMRAEQSLRLTILSLLFVWVESFLLQILRPGKSWRVEAAKSRRGLYSPEENENGRKYSEFP